MEAKVSRLFIRCLISICPPLNNSACRRDCHSEMTSSRRSSKTIKPNIITTEKVIYIKREEAVCRELPAIRNLARAKCSNGNEVKSKCFFECEKGFLNIGSKKKTCKMGIDSPGMGIYYGILADWNPAEQPKCVGKCLFLADFKELMT